MEFKTGDLLINFHNFHYPIKVTKDGLQKKYFLINQVLSMV